MKATPSESWLLPLACAPIKPHPRPSYTVPSPPTRKLKHIVSVVVDLENEQKLIRRNTSFIFLQYAHVVHASAFKNGISPDCWRSFSLVSNVIEVLFCHMRSLDADKAVGALLQACALWEGSVVNDHSLGSALQSRLLSRGSRSPLRPRNNVHWIAIYRWSEACSKQKVGLYLN